MTAIRQRVRALLHGASYLALDPSPRLRRLREQQERTTRARRIGPLPPLPDSAYGADAVPLDTSGIPDEPNGLGAWDW